MALTNLTPVTRREIFLDKIAGSETSASPVTRLEKYLDAIAAAKAGGTPNAPDPATRTEYFLKKISESFSGGSLEMETGYATAATPRENLLYIPFSNSHDRPPDFVFATIAKDAWDVSEYTTSDILSFVYVYFENIGTVLPLETSGFGLYGVAQLFYYSSSGNLGTQYVVTGLFKEYDPDDLSTTNSTRPQYYVNNTALTLRTPSTTARYFQAGADYFWGAYWLN